MQPRCARRRATDAQGFRHSTTGQTFNNIDKMSLWGCEELYVTGLPSDVTEPELRGLFGAHGTVKEAVVVNKKAPSAPNAPQSCIVRQVRGLRGHATTPRCSALSSLTSYVSGHM